MVDVDPLSLEEHLTPDAAITHLADGRRRLEIPAGPSGKYRLAQLDDYTGRSRKNFPWHPPVSMEVQARASDTHIPGTWGFGFWNDPFSFSLGMGGGQRRFPALPNAAWFFFASVQNYLSFRNDLPAWGALASTFSVASVPAIGMALAAPALPLVALPFMARLARQGLRHTIQQSARQLGINPTEWHTYRLDWLPEQVSFQVDGQAVFDTEVSPRGPLGFVIWVDNQFAAWPPDGRLTVGTLPNTEAVWIEAREISVSSFSPGVHG